jgi:3-oxoacyl-[acyl-carrier-protein] synthase II
MQGVKGQTMERKRIVITGVGVVSPIGIGKDTYWEGLRQGKSGIKPITLFDTSDFDVKVGGEVSDFDAKEILGKRGLVDLDRATTLLLSSAKFALEDSGLEINEEESENTGISSGTTFGSLSSLSEFDRASIKEGPHFVNPSRFPNTVINSPASRLAIRHNIKGMNATVSTGFCAALDAVDYAIQGINNERVGRVLTCCVEEMCVQSFFGFYKLGYLSGLSGKSNPLSCPFDKRRDGIILSEGAVCLILEERSFAIKRKAPIYGEILSTASAFNPRRPHKFRPNDQGMVNAMQLALKKAHLKAKDIDCIYAHANSTKDADLAESKAIKKVFGQSQHDVVVTAIKSMLGETYSASGGMALTAALASLCQNFVPPTINYLEQDPDCGMDLVSSKRRDRQVNNIMINSFDPSGASTVAIVGRNKE